MSKNLHVATAALRLFRDHYGPGLGTAQSRNRQERTFRGWIEDGQGTLNGQNNTVSGMVCAGPGNGSVVGSMGLHCVIPLRLEVYSCW